MTKNIYMGIDPGQTGAAALYNGKNIIDMIDYTDPVDVADKIKKWLWEYKIKIAILERVHSMPKQGVSSTFLFGTNFGIWQGLLAAFQIPHELVAPQRWQKGLITKSDGKNTKEQSLTVARRFFPGSEYFKRKKDHNRADAVLMAIFAERLIWP